MLSIRIHNEEDTITFTPRGDLSGNGVDELRCYYRVLCALPMNKSVIVDVSGITSFDEAGAHLLTEMVQRGAEVVAGMPPTSLPLSEILKNAVPTSHQAVKGPTTEPLPLRTILYATDLSPCSEAVLPYVCSLARQHSARVVVAHVIPPTAYIELPPELRDRADQAAGQFIEEQLRTLAGSASLKDVEHEIFVDHGEVWPVLSNFIEKHAVDLVAIGTHGRRGIKKLLWGSVAEEIFRLSERPVLTVGPRALATAARDVSFRSILVATDFSPESVHALDYGVRLCSKQQGRLTLIHVLQAMKALATPARMMEAKLFRECIRDLNPNMDGQLEPEYIVEFGSPAATILHAAEERHTDLIILGLDNKKRHIGTHLFGATAYAVISGAPCPVLTIRGSGKKQQSHVDDQREVSVQIR